MDFNWANWGLGEDSESSDLALSFWTGIFDAKKNLIEKLTIFGEKLTMFKVMIFDFIFV